MTILHVEISTQQAAKLGDLAKRENLSVEELAARILGDAVAQVDYFEQRAARGDRGKFLKTLGNVPKVPPTPPDTPYKLKRVGQKRTRSINKCANED